MSNLVHSSTLRNNLADVLDSLEKKPKDYLLVTRKGKPKVAMVNLDFFEDLLALSSPKYLKDIKQARKQIKKGESFTHDEVFGEL